ncbi:hypothetical protein VKT23_010179 [Stygiomarasmius scandens]|uniref:Uncharacterized protein n=1 Tax=Marasmiellus scandens TaxID=2682957 RepID=A0ABR1JC93_9AGAR
MDAAAKVIVVLVEIFAWVVDCVAHNNRFVSGLVAVVVERSAAPVRHFTIQLVIVSLDNGPFTYLDGGCCPSGWYCVVASNGRIGCCLDGEICSGPAPDPITTFGNGGGDSGATRTTADEDTFTTTSTRTRTSLFTSTPSTSLPFNTFGNTTIPTRTTSSSAFVPQATPSPDPGFTNIFVPPTDAQINWSGGGWSDTSSSCGTSQCRKTTIEGQWFTFIAPLNASGASLYIDVTWEITWFDIFINGQLSDITPSDIDTCSWKQIGPLPTGGQANITIVVVGPLRSGRRQTGSIDDWTFEFNGFLVGQKSPTSDSNTDIGHATTSRPTAALFMMVALFVTIIFSGF